MTCAYRVWNQPGGKLIFGGRGEQKFGGEWSESTGGGGGDFSRWGEGNEQISASAGTPISISRENSMFA